MKGTPAIYLGRIVDKKHFRVFIYGAHGQKRLVESWDAFEAAMESGVWFATLQDAETAKAPVKSVESAENVVLEEKTKLRTKLKENQKSRNTIV